MIPAVVPERMRIAFVYDALVPFLSGGAERRYHEIAIRLAERHDVHYVTWRFWGPEPTLRRDGITHHGVGPPRHFYGSDGKRTIREAAEFALRLPATLARVGADVIDASATPYLPLYAAWATSRVSRTPLVATWHEFWGAHWADYLPDRRAVAWIARALEAGARPLADRRVAVSAFTKRRMAAGASGDDEAPATDVVANGVDLAALTRARPAPERSDVLFVGRLIDEKRVDVLIQAMARVAASWPTVRCVIVGDGPERAGLVALAEREGVSDRISFVGRVDDDRLTGLMHGSRILAMPSIREGYGMVVVEGQACGLVPVIARSPLSAAPDLVTHGHDGVVSGPTPDAFATAIGGLLADPAGLAWMSSAARRTAAGRGWDDRAADMERIYAGLVADRGRVRRTPFVTVDAE